MIGGWPRAVPRYAAAMQSSLNVFFDGSCPMCVREVAAYRRQSPPDVVWNNLAEPGLEVPYDAQGFRPTPEALMKRFHVLTRDGHWLHGAPAFAALWSRLGAPWRWLSGIGRVPGGLWLMDAVYALFLRARPALQRVVHHLVRPDTLPVPMIPALRSDHAGETGAVWIYRAMLAIHRDAALRVLLEEHLEQEQRHLAAFNALLPWRCRSRLLVPWRVAGALTGLVAAIGGRRWTLATIAAVERFVDQHYLEQIEQLEALIGLPQQASVAIRDAGEPGLVGCQTGTCTVTEGRLPATNAIELLEFLKACRQDECRHRDDALTALHESTRVDPERERVTGGWALAAWCALVDRGSVLAVKAAKAL